MRTLQILPGTNLATLPYLWEGEIRNSREIPFQATPLANRLASHYVASGARAVSAPS
jgi:hypothetical protein